ncbi:MAG: protein kinase, partial [Gemmataceae bacterium]|nr:protein kinase [Gemmataceae bacterium]
MAQVWKCSRGHQWEVNPTALLPTAVTLSCPVCGTAEVNPGQPHEAPATRPTVPIEAMSEVSAADDTLHRPGPPPTRPTDARPGSFLPPRSMGTAPSARATQPPTAPPRSFLPPGLVPAPLDETLPPPASSEKTPLVGSHPAAPLTHDTGETLQRLGGPPTHTPKDEASVPGYEIVSLLGRGGMGVVYKARQVALNRLVALKMILAGAHAGEEDRVRFQTEAESAARLQHPNIVQVYEVGERNGMPFFSLEYVEGGTLQQKLAGTPMPVQQAAHLVEQIARAMHYAHQKGIVHRDLKPANVLLTVDGTPKITDFGLAKRLEADSQHTGTGAILGTPNYMAPEQAMGRTRAVGPPADVYALGAILYDLLTGRPPFRGETVLDTLQQVQSTEPVPPSRLQPKLPRDLETICLKCLQKEPERRYASAEALADDLRRYQQGQPIEARPTPTWERVLKWARRRPAAAALLVLSVVTLVGVGVGGFLVASQEAYLRDLAEKAQSAALKERDRANLERAEAERQRGRAETHLQHAFKAGDELLTHVAEDRLANEPGMEDLRRSLLHGARRFYQKFFEVEGRTPEARWQTAQAHLRVGLIEEKVGDYDLALEAYQSGERLLRELGGDAPNPIERLEALGQAQRKRGEALEALGKHDAARRACEDSIATLRGLAQDVPGPRSRRLLVTALVSWAGQLKRDPASQPQAEKAYREALGLLDALCAAAPKDPRYRSDRASTQSNLATLLTATNPKEAEVLSRRALEEQKALAAEFPAARQHQADQGNTLLQLGVLWEALGRRKDAAQACREAAALFEKLVQDFPRVTDHRHNLARAYTILGLILEDGKDLEQAEQVRQKARPHWRKLAAETRGFAVFRKELARSLADESRYLRFRGEPQKAEKALAEAIALQEKLVEEFAGTAEYRIDLARTLIDLGQLVGECGQAEREEKEYRRAIDLLTKARPKPGPAPAGWLALMVEAHHNLAAPLLERQQWARATTVLLDLIGYQGEVCQAAPKDTAQRQRLASYYGFLLDVLANQKDHAGAARAAREGKSVLRA